MNKDGLKDRFKQFSLRIIRLCQSLPKDKVSEIKGRTQTQIESRKTWYEQFVQPRFIDLFAQVPTYWEKDDHDHRYNDCDTTGDKKPSSKLGIKTFLEQVPVVNPRDIKPKTYRTHRTNKLLQIWLLEGRDYRSPNNMPDNPEKSLWGKKQKEWFKTTLLESDAIINTNLFGIR